MNIRRQNMGLAGIIGHPVENSLMPALHNWALQKLGLDATFMRWSVPAEKIGIFVASLRLLQVYGVCVSVPHREAIIPYLDGLTAEAEAVGAVNTLLWKDGELMGENTEVQGFTAPLQDMVFDEALVLGAGGAARSVLVGLNKLKVPKITVCARNPRKAGHLAAFFGCGVINWADRLDVLRDAGNADGPQGARLIMVNATPAGSFDAAGAGSPLSSTDLGLLRYPQYTVVYDLVYNPTSTDLLRLAGQAGCAVLGGLPMLTMSGLEQARLWYGQSLPYDEASGVLMQGLESPGA